MLPASSADGTEQERHQLEARPPTPNGNGQIRREMTMHEIGLINDLMNQIHRIAREQNARRITRVEVRLGALCHIGAAHFREHFRHCSAGTIVEGAELVLREATRVDDAHAQEILLESIQIESPEDV